MRSVSSGAPCPRLQECIEGNASGEVVDGADEARERALGDDLEEIGVGQAGVVGALYDLGWDLAALDRDLAGERVNGGVDGVGRLGSCPHPLDVDLVDTEGREDSRMERHAIGVVDGDANRHAGDLSMDRRKRRVGHCPTERVEGGEQGWAGCGNSGEVGHEANVGGDAVEQRSRIDWGGFGCEGVEVHGTDHPESTDRWPFPPREATARHRGRSVAAMTGPLTVERHTFGDVVRHWRRVRAMSQLDLAAAASTTPRYMSFVETGRSQPSREMVLRLAASLDVPLRERNGLLVAAGFAPIYPEHDLDHPAIDRVTAALDRVLDQHAPYPAVVMNRRWDVVRINPGAARLFAGLCAPDPVPDPANVLRLMLEPGPVRAAVENWNEVAPSLLERARREAVGGMLDLATADLVHGLRTGADAAVFAAAPRSIAPLVPVIDVHFRYGKSTLRWFSVVSTIGTPVDITAQELRLEAFFPSDDDTAARWSGISTAITSP